MITPQDYSKQVVGWAASVIRNNGWNLESNGEGGWYIETPKGWITADNSTELAKIARQAQS